MIKPVDSKMKTCELCNKIFKPNAPNQKFCSSNECRRYSHMDRQKREVYLRKNKHVLDPLTTPAAPATPAAPTTSSKKTKQNIIGKELNGVIINHRFITKYKQVAESVVMLMQKSKLQNYPIYIQETCHDIMYHLRDFLNKQLNDKKEVIIINAEN